MTSSRLLALCVWMSLLCRTVVATADEPQFRRWALLPAPEITATGLSDLLTSDLSQRSLELVEREQLAAIAKEYELSKLLGADGASQRLEVGQLVQADALVLLSLIEHDKKQFVKLVISDCRYGSRLRLEHFEFAADQADKLAVEIADATVATRTKFAGGIERIVAVAPFLSKNLTHEFDHLQFGFAALVGQGLSERPGVAVLEIEEARAISDELTRATAEIDRRAVPIFVESEFEIADRTAANRAGSVHFAVWLRSGQQQPKTLEHTGATLAEASNWLIESLPNQIAEQEARAGAKPLTRAEQRDALTHRAERFSQIAAYPQSAALREAALLLEPDDWEARVLLIADLTRRMNQMIFGGAGELSSNKLRDDAEYRRRCVAELHALVAGVEAHTERVLAAGVLNLREANHLLGVVALETTMIVNDERLDLVLRSQYRDFYWRCLARAVRLDPRIRGGGVHPVLSKIRGAGTQKASTLFEQHSDFAGQVGYYLIDSLPLRRRLTESPRLDDTETVRDLERLFDLLLPDQFSGYLVQRLTQNAKGSVPFLVISKRVPAADVIKLYERLREKQQPLLEFYARVGLLALKSTGAVAGPVTPADIAELDWLDAFVVEWQKQHPKEPSIGVFGKSLVLELRKPLTQALSAGTARKAARPMALRLEGADPYPRLAFEPLDMTATWTTLSPCGPGRDLVWSWETVGVLTAPGQLKTIIKLERDPARLFVDQDSTCSAVWDGEFIWVAGTRSGVRIFDPDGKQLGQLLPSSEAPAATTSEATALPPVEPFSTFSARGLDTLRRRSLWLYPLGPGRCFAAGRFGKDYRRWFGVIERHPEGNGPSAWRFTRWHQLTKQVAANSPDDDLETIFTPSYVADYLDPLDHRRWLVLGRNLSKQNGFVRTPLAFQVDTGAVSFFPRPLNTPLAGPEGMPPPTIGDSSVFVSQGGIVRVDHAGEQQIPTPHSLFMTETKPRLPGEPLVIRDRPDGLRPELLAVGEWLYNPGVQWRRINTRLWEVEPLTQSAVSLRYEFESYAVSAHYGLVAWNHGDPLCRVHVDPPADQARPLSWLYPFVPAEVRERHHRAVEEICRLGGQVDTVPRDAKPIGFPRTEPWRTVVWLTETWQGGDDGLRHLADLHNVRDLFLERAPITDEGLKTVSQLKALYVLHVTDTQATSAGVQSLAALPELTHLWLENPAGSTLLGDDALVAFKGKPKLFQLTLGGRGFTDKSLSHVLEIPRLFHLRLTDTDTTAAAIAAAKQKRPSLRFPAETNQ